MTETGKGIESSRVRETDVGSEEKPRKVVVSQAVEEEGVRGVGAGSLLGIRT